MNTLWKVTPWFGRLVLLAATILFSMIAAKGVLNPVQTASASGIVFNSPQGVTITRVGFGGFPLVFAALLLCCLVSAKRTITGLGLLVALAGITLAVRLFGISMDGTLAQNMFLLRAEAGMFAFSSAALGLNLARSRRSHTWTPTTVRS